MFLLDDRSRHLVRTGVANRLFLHEEGPAAFAYPDDPEAAVAHDEGWAIDTFRRSGFQVSVQHGGWSGRADGVGAQDLVIGVRSEAPQSPIRASFP
jgi:hypothetical protein